jgi:uroporphyrin-III C-methyltransferase/precorrin-2 dehydrogenase/sirohydrochlorin ferrochelatase
MIENGATSAQRVLRGTLGDLAERVEAADIAGPALLIIGDVVGLDHIADATSLTAATNTEIWSDTAPSDQLISRGSR